MGKRYGHVTIEERCEIARLQASGYSVSQIAASLDRSPSTVARELKRKVQELRDTSPGMRTSKPMPGVGVVLDWSEMRRCGIRCSLGLSRAGHRSRWRDGWPWSQAVQSSPTRAYIGSSTARLLVRRTTAGATTCPELSPSVVGEATKAAALLPSWLSVVPSPSARRALLTAALLVTGRPT